MRTGLRCAALLLLAGSPLRAQVVRGTVRDADTQAPLPGVIVSLDQADAPDSVRSSLVLAVLTDEQGRYSVQATAAGRYRITAKRVGFKRVRSDPFVLGVGQARALDLTLARIDLVTSTLATVEVTTDAPCAVDPAEGRRVASLWDEARAALTATQLALRDRLFRATSVRYTRDLHPASLRIRSEDRVVRRGVAERPFRSLEAARLSRDGYVQRQPDGATVYYAPDAEALTAPEFLRDHCFVVAKGDRGRTGLAFQPVRDRAEGDIRGTMWFDSATYELQAVEFQYVNLAEFAIRATARGEVRFGRLPNGTWYVQRWFIRMPELRAARPGATQPMGGGLELAGYREEGGDVAAEGSKTTGLASLAGRALDSTGRAPLRGATVRLAGTRYEAPVRADGSFRLDSLPAGAWTLRLEHPTYAQLGIAAGEQDLEIAEGSASVTAMQALSTSFVLQHLCRLPELPEDRAVVRVRVVTAEGHAVAGATIALRHEQFEATGGRLANLAVRPITLEGVSDAEGAMNACDLPARQPIRVTVTRPGERESRAQVVSLDPKAVAVVTFRP